TWQWALLPGSWSFHNLRPGTGSQMVSSVSRVSPPAYPEYRRPHGRPEGILLLAVLQFPVSLYFTSRNPKSLRACCFKSPAGAFLFLFVVYDLTEIGFQ